MLHPVNIDTAEAAAPLLPPVDDEELLRQEVMFLDDPESGDGQIGAQRLLRQMLLGRRFPGTLLRAFKSSASTSSATPASAGF